MSQIKIDPHQKLKKACGPLLHELQVIWDEVGESDVEREEMLLELEQQCLELYRRKVDQANHCRAQLRQAIADSEAELASICSSMGERPVHIRQSDQASGSLKEELQRILPQLDNMRKRKSDRKNQFLEVLDQIKMISNEINGSLESPPEIIVDENDLSLRTLEERHKRLHDLQKDKSDRLKQVLDHLKTLNSLCSVLGMDFGNTVNEVHSSLGDMGGPKSISNDTIMRLTSEIEKLHEIKLQRMQKLQDLATTMLELWHLMDTPVEEQQVFRNVTCNIAASEHEMTEPNTLSVDCINSVEAEVQRLEDLKSSRMKDLVLKKRLELEDICQKTHLVPEIDTGLDSVIEAIESGFVDAASVLEQIELEIAEAKEEAFSRKEILEKVEKWLAACEEESWLEEYNQDENRYNAGRGTHLILKRAEKARNLVSKIPAMVEALSSKTVAWESDRSAEFKYDGIRLLSMLEKYTILRQEREQERRRKRDQKKLQGQLVAEQEALYGSKASPSKPQSAKKTPRMSTGGANSRKLSFGGATNPAPKSDVKFQSRPSSRKGDHLQQNDQFNHQDDGYSALSVVAKGLEGTALPIKKYSSGALTSREVESPAARKPFTPMSPDIPSKANTTHFSNDISRTQGQILLHKAAPANNAVFSTPLKTINIVDEEDKTSKAMPIPFPSTPSTISVSMLTAMTPASSPAVAATEVEGRWEEIEYSFEEKRAGFVVPRVHLNSMVQV